MFEHRKDLFRIDVLGAFRTTTPDGTDKTPKGAKNQGLLAMLAMSPNMNRPRRWLEDKLWSTFGPEQASANLRQALSKLRSELAPDSDLLGSDRRSVWLDQSRIRVDLLEEVVPADERTELLEGLDIRDPEFEDWLRQERAHLQAMVSRATPSDSRGILVNCRPEGDGSMQSQMMSEALSNHIGENVAEQVRAWRQGDPLELGSSAAPESDVMIHSQLVADGNGFMLFLKATHNPSARILYSKLQRIEGLNAIIDCDTQVGRTIYEAADQILGKLPHVLEKDRPESRATALSRLALYRMFSFDQDALREAYGLMEQAYRHDENPVYLAWSSLIRTAQLIELSEPDQSDLKDETIALSCKAIELGADNGLVHAIVSKVRGTGVGDLSGVLDLARTAVDRNPASAFGWKALSDAYLRLGDAENAFVHSSRARNLARSSPFKHFWDSGHCIVAIAAGRMEEALEAGEAAARAAPLSRPALRHLLALYALKNEFAKAQAVAEKLTKIEPGFTIERLIDDDTYPVRTLRNNGLLEPIRALL